ncbi:MAG: hypothetical protein Kow0074_23140 [Candidatus Zixiibacteriota bacterium]
MLADRLQRIATVIVLALLVFVLVAMPFGDALVMADGGGSGHPIEPPPADSTQNSIQPAPELESVNEVSLLLTGLSVMVM